MNKSKRIGILTLTPSSNYGGILQTVALYNYLERQGYDVILINKKFFIRSKIKKVILSLLKNIPGQNIKNFRYNYLKEKSLLSSINKYIPNRTKKIYNVNSFRDLIQEYKYHAVIVGSDQVWRYKYINDGSYNCYFLDFIKSQETKKISYAASFGIDYWENKKNVGEVSAMLKDFDHISVRENSGVKICSEDFGVNAEHVLDPTILLTPEDYNEILNIKEDGEENILCSYILDSDVRKSKFIEGLAKKNSLEIKALGSKSSNNKFYTVKDWVSSIKNSKFVVTDSFHGMVFSIIFNRQFIVIGNKNRGLARFQSLLSKFGLSERILELENLDMGLDIANSVIDYQQVNLIVEHERLVSMSFLKNSIK